METRVWHQCYDQQVSTSLEYPDHPVDKFLTHTAKQFPDNNAIIFSGGLIPLFGEQHTTLTYRQLESLVNRFAVGLQALGLKKGDRVALYMPNCPQYIIAYYGTLRAGCIAVPSNPLYVAREIEHQLNDSGAKMVVTLSMLYKNVKQIRKHTKLEHVVVTNIKEHFPALLKILFTLTKEKKDGHAVDISGDADTSWFNEFLAPAGKIPTPVKIKPSDTAVLMYTGGTTGVPKGAQLTHGNVVANPTQAAAWISPLNLNFGKEVMLTVLPMTHSYSMTCCLNLSVSQGYTQVVIPDPRNLPHLLTVIDKHQVTLAPGVPTLYNALANHEDVKAGKFSLKSIKLCLSGASGLPLDVHTNFTQRTGSTLVEAYGMSETSPALLVNPLGGGAKLGTIGIPIPDTDVMIVDEETEETPLGPGKTGVLCAHGPQVMKGYWNMPVETANTLREHQGKTWIHTGDIAQMDEEGYFRIVDRKKDMILASSGFNVYPRDIEERLFEHPKILEAAAIGVPPHSKDQRAKVFVVLHPNETLTEEAVIEWCREGLAKYKVPKFVEFRDSLPKTMVGKVLRRALVEEEDKQ